MQAQISFICFVLSTYTLPTSTQAYGDITSFLQVRLDSGSRDEGPGQCADLHNKDTHFAVKVTLGTPMNGEKPQTFNLLADTGSDSVIVTSCICVEKGLCDAKDHCFRGANHSSTFNLLKAPQLRQRSDLGRPAPELQPVGVRMAFGTGSLTSVIGTDFVEVGGVKAKLDDGVLLMVDRSELAMDGPFEGILGLGPPKVDDSMPLPARSSEDDPAYHPKSFLEEAGVSRFSMCLNDAAHPGALRLNVPEFTHSLPAIGSFHWGVGLFGIHVGSVNSNAIFCDANTMTSEQKSPCGAIPDSGATLLMGPEEQVTKVFESICDDWDRCRTAIKGPLENVSRSDAFQKLLYDCGDWLTDEHGINEVPSVFLTMGVPGNLQRIELTAWSYIVEADEELYKHNIKYMGGATPVDIPQPTGKFRKVCTPSFGVQDYKTKENGPVWILGAPLFYQYTVGYGLDGKGANGGAGSMAFVQQPCNLCNETQVNLLSTQTQLTLGTHKPARSMRIASSPPRVPNLDTSLPL